MYAIHESMSNIIALREWMASLSTALGHLIFLITSPETLPHTEYISSAVDLEWTERL